MFLQSVAPVISAALAKAKLAALSTVPGAALLTTPHVHLYTAGPAPVLPTSTVSQFTEATFTGYAAIALPTLSAPVNLSGLNGYAVFGGVNFIAGSLTAGGQVILGYWVDDGATDFYCGEAFAQSVAFSQPGDFLDLQVLFGETPYTKTT